MAAGKLSANESHKYYTIVKFVNFLQQVAEANPGNELHGGADNYSTYNHPYVKDWLAANPGGEPALYLGQMNLAEHGEVLLQDRHQSVIEEIELRDDFRVGGRGEPHFEKRNKEAEPPAWTKSSEHLLSKTTHEAVANVPGLDETQPNNLYGNNRSFLRCSS